METQSAARKSSAVRASRQKGESDSRRKRQLRTAHRNREKHLPSGRIAFSKEGYAVVFERSRTGWGAYAPDVPGCIAVARTLAETRKLFQSALRMHLEAMLEDGDPIPQALTHVEHIAA